MQSSIANRLAAKLTGSGVTEKADYRDRQPAGPSPAQRRLPSNLPKDGQLQGKIDAKILLARLADILALDDQTMEGTLLADITIGGTLGEPKIEGPDQDRERRLRERCHRHGYPQILP